MQELRHAGLCQPSTHLRGEWLQVPSQALCLSLLQESVMSEEDEEIYVCQCCGHEDHPDGFGALCPSCGIDLDGFEEPGARYPIR